MRDVMQSFNSIEETLSLNIGASSLFEKVLQKPMGKVKEHADHKACQKYLEISAGLGEEHP